MTAVRESERDGYRAVQLAFGEAKERRLQKARRGHLKKAGAPALKHLAEFHLGADEDGDPKIGDQVTVAAFEPGQRVKVSGRSKGKGFQGTIRRHNFHRGPGEPRLPQRPGAGLDRRQRDAVARPQGHPDARATWATVASHSSGSRCSRSTRRATS